MGRQGHQAVCSNLESAGYLGSLCVSVQHMRWRSIAAKDEAIGPESVESLPGRPALVCRFA